MLAPDTYEALPQTESYVGSGRFGLVKKVRRRSDKKVGDYKLYSGPKNTLPLICRARSDFGVRS